MRLIHATRADAVENTSIAQVYSEVYANTKHPHKATHGLHSANITVSSDSYGFMRLRRCCDVPCDGRVQSWMNVLFYNAKYFKTRRSPRKKIYSRAPARRSGFLLFKHRQPCLEVVLRWLRRLALSVPVSVSNRIRVHPEQQPVERYSQRKEPSICAELASDRGRTAVNC